MDPNAVHKAETKHDHQHEGAAVTDQRQRHAGNWQQRDGHSDILKDACEDKRRDPNGQKKP